ncbi:hypothetical protein QQX98_005109 [Neonectria punicea]|uniref:NACHT domain-containing protein n=1 Tax=Neonectria punicea TaxID=979145 RepID=A0ABR1H698_9HYPO
MATATVNNGLHSANNVFAQVAENFRNSLHDKEKKLFREFDSPARMIKELEAEVSTYQNGSKLARMCRKIDRFASTWAPFFAIISIFVQSNPEYSGVAWGAVRLVFLLGTNFNDFLEKIVSMFEKLSDRLPGYAEYHERVVKRWEKILANNDQLEAYEARRLRMAKSLSYIYADIMQFCQECCKIFSTKKGGARYKRYMIADVFWKPFDMRFADILDRLQSHQALFNNEMQLEESRFMEMQFERREFDAGMTKEAMEQIQKQVKDLSNDINSKDNQIASALTGFDQRLEFMINNARNDTTDFAREAECLEYMDVLERAQSRRASETCKWFTSSPEYLAWKSYKFPTSGAMDPPSNSAMKPILFITGLGLLHRKQSELKTNAMIAKPGFGKTTMSSAIIEDLDQAVHDSHLSDDEVNGVLFYHFTAEWSNRRRPIHAFASLLTQFIHRFRNQKDVIDLVSVLYDNNSNGQLTASSNQVMECLVILLANLNGMTVVIDGIDECVDDNAFLTSLHHLCTTARTKCLVLSRPSIDLPPSFTQFISFRLDHTNNREDISRYLTPGIQSLLEQSLISPEYGSKKIVTTLTMKSAGMFLWAYLTIQFLNCKALSLNDRRDAIFSANTVEGIDGLYAAILDVLCKSYSKQRQRTQRIFWLLAVTERSLSVSELQIALAIQPGKVTDKNDFIPDLGKNLPSICGALVEVSKHDDVSLIHPSLRDFLTTPGEYIDRSSFFVNLRDRNLDAASMCLSYIVYDMPRCPLQQSGRSKASRWSLQVLFPFLQYSLFWTKHAVQGLNQVDPSETSKNGDACSKFLSLLGKFMQERLSVTAWIEASWTFDSLPLLDVLETALSKTARSLPDLNELVQDLYRLHEEWGHLLSQSPNAIWKSNLTAFTQSRFFLESQGFHVSSLAPPFNIDHSEFQAILVQSQESTSGLVLGIVMVIPSPAYISIIKRVFGEGQERDKIHLTEPQRETLIRITSQGWKFKYEQRSVQTEKVIMTMEHELPEEDVHELLSQSLASNQPDRFPFPVALSGDLDRLVVLRTLFTICTGPSSRSDGGKHRIKIQRLAGTTPSHEVAASLSQGAVAYSPTFSPNGTALAFAVKKPSPGQIKQRNIEIWVLQNPASDDSVFKLRGSVTASWLSMINESNENGSFGFLFHPDLPIIIYSDWIQMSAWWFSLTASSEGPEGSLVGSEAYKPKKLRSLLDLDAILESYAGFEAYPATIGALGENMRQTL